MSLDNRNTSAQFKRAEQLKRWEESEMNKKLSGVPKSPSSRRIKFSSGCIFLAACVAGDKEEVEWLLKNGADIDTANVDGLTALHQACIDDNLDMVEFLVQKGADVNRKDNEGWTPLHATASCGFLSIARYLIENGADLASINSDGELAVDLASSDAMEDLIQHHLDEQGIDCDEARQAEERIMLSDATKWLRTDSSDCDKAHPKTGATAIHVAAAKGYIGVLKLLLEGRGDIDRQDVDGWTPLHAAAYWGQKEATQMLLNASADIDIQNYSGQLAIDIAQDDIVPLLKDARKNVKRTKRRPPSHGNRITDNFETSTETPTKVIRVEMKPIDSNKEKEAGPVAVAHDDDDDDEDVYQAPSNVQEEPEDEEESNEKDEEEEEETVDDTVDEELEEEEEEEEEEEDDDEQEVDEDDEEKEEQVVIIEQKPGPAQDVPDSTGIGLSYQRAATAQTIQSHAESKPNQAEEADSEEEEEEEEENASVSSEPYSSSNPSADSSLTESETDELLPRPVPIISRPAPVPLTTQIVAPKPRVTETVPSATATTTAASNPPPPTAPWRRQRATPTPVPRQFYEDQQQPATVSRAADDVDYANLYYTSKRNLSEKENKPTEPDVILRRTQSFESDEKFYQRYAELRARIQANSCPHTILPSTPINTKTSTASNNNNNNNSSNTNNNNNNNTTTTTASAPASNISSYLVQRSASLKDHRTLRKTASNLVLGSTTTSPSSATPTTTTTTTTGPASGVPTNTSIVPPATGTTTAVSQATGNTTVSSGAVSSPPTSPSGTPTTTPTAGQIRSSIPTPVTTTSTTTNNNKNIMLNSNTDNSSSTPFGDRYRKRYEDQPEVVRKPPQTNNHNNNSTIADHHTTTTSVAGDVLPTTGSGGGGNNATTTAATTGTDTSKNHSLFELNRKYIEQAQKTKINNERNKFLSSLNEKRQQQLQEQQGQSGGGTAGRTEATQAQASIEEPAEVKLIIATSTAAAPTPPTVDAHNATATTPVTISPSSNKLSPGNIFKNFFKSFVPPTRDEESETQRKAHAKRVRETRRSTQGVTLDEIKSAEQLVKKKNASGAGNENDTMASATSASTTTTTSSSPSSLSSSASPSFTTNNATTISGTAAINDRVPSVGDSTDQQQSGGGGNHVSEGSGKDSGSEVAVSASFTIAAPSSALDDGGDGGGGGGHRRHRRSVGAGGGNDEEEDDIKVSYTISAPVRPSSPGRRATVNNSKESTTDPPAAAGSDILGGTDADVPVVSATFHVPAVSEAGVVATTATIRTSGTAAGGVVSSSDSNTTTITNTTSASSNTNHNTAATYTKRSLFDIDNANSLTLAEKLRHEANKYAIAAVADGDLDSHSAVPRVPNSNSTTTNSGGESNSNSTNAPADNSAVSAAAAAAVPPSPTLRKAADSGAASTTTGVTAERRPSWRLKVDGGSKFKLEDASTPNAATQSSSVASGSVYESVPATQATEHGLTTTKLTSSSALAQRRAQQQNGDSTTTTTTTGSSVAGSAIGSRPLSASGLAAGEQYNRVPGSNASSAGEPTTAANSGTDTSPLHHLRRPPKSTTAGEENKENDKENDSRTSSTTAQATQAVIQRRRRQKRRSTGVVSVGIEDLDPDRQDSPVDGEDKETGSERGRSRVGSTASELDTANQPQDSTRENGGDCIDYKALYEQEKADNDKLKMSLRKKDEEVVTLKAALDRFTTATTKNNSLSELEKRERRAMERKMSEMEEELKLLQKYKTENERLRAENRALTRVVSKLTTSAQNQVHAAAANKQ
ncbi:protein phosphatase 1 regulatory subunit 12A isoform X2 [Anopheles stephensi]|uniref:protein phosphatase 1 regulatory subunit 12A isoform X2 n=1 Tax=Anopheles stephensi TaxID=30069 RepID=UPI001658AC0D|nr:protein phosphatase 1 regulatory subunit 12A isoform X2 [Anopheles stephensi]